METVVERIRRIGRESASPVEASPATQQAIASPPEQSITPSQPDEREQAIVDRHTSEAPNIGFLQRGARGIAQMEIETRKQQRDYAEKAKSTDATTVDLTKEMLKNLNNRSMVLDIYRQMSPAQRQEVLNLAPGLAQEIGDDRGGIPMRAFNAVTSGISDVAQPIMELAGQVTGTDWGGTPEEIEFIRQLQGSASQEFAPARPGDPWYQKGPLQALQMTPWMATTIGGGIGGGAAAKAGGQVLARGASAGVPGAKAVFQGVGAVGKIPKIVGLKGATTKATMEGLGTVAGITAAGFPSQYAQEVDSLKELGMEDNLTMRLLAGGTAAVASALESVIPNPLKAGPVPLTQGAVKAARQYLWNAAKQAPGEMSEEYLQGVTSGLGQWVAQYLDENAEDKSIADAFQTGYEQAKEAALPMAFLLGVPAVGGAANAARLARLQAIRNKGFVSTEDAQKEGIEGKNRKERLANADAAIKQLEQEAAAAPTPTDGSQAKPWYDFGSGEPEGDIPPPPGLGLLDRLTGRAPQGTPPRLPGAPGATGATGAAKPPLPTETKQGKKPPLPEVPAAAEEKPAATKAEVESLQSRKSELESRIKILEADDLNPDVDDDIASLREELGQVNAQLGTPAPQAPAEPPQTTPKPTVAPEAKVEPAKPQAAQEKEPANPEWDIRKDTRDGKLYRYDPNAKTKLERQKTRQPVGPSEGVVIETHDFMDRPIPPETLAARKEFVDKAKPGTTFRRPNFNKNALFEVGKDGKISSIESTSKRPAGSVQELANTISPGDITELTEPSAGPSEGSSGSPTVSPDAPAKPETSKGKAAGEDQSSEARAGKSKQSPRVYREMAADELYVIIDPNTSSGETFGGNERFWSDNPDLAIGQGSNKGFVVELDPSGLDLKEHAKPATAIPGVGKEFTTRHRAGEFRPGVRSITVKPGQSTSSAIRVKRFLEGEVKAGRWTKSKTDSGGVRYSPVAEAEVVVSENPVTSVPFVETYDDIDKLPRHSVYQRDFRGQRKFMVRSDGERGGGDGIFDTEQEAREYASVEIKREQQRDEATARREQREAEEAKKEADYVASFKGFRSDSPMAFGKAKQALEKQVRYRNKVQTRKQIVEQAVADGAVVKDGDRLEYPDGAFLDVANITKTGLDYAEHLISQKQREQSSKSPPESKWQSETRSKLESVPALKGAKIETDEKAGTAKVTRPDGLETTIHFNADEELAKAAKAKLRNPKSVYGRYVRAPGAKTGDIYIRSDANHTNILNHEVMHWLEDQGVVTKEEVEQYGGREAIADKYGKWAELKQRSDNKLFDKIRKFLEPLLSAQSRFFEEVGARQASKPAKPDRPADWSISGQSKPIPGMESEEATYTVHSRKPDVIPDTFSVVVAGKPTGKGWTTVKGTGMSAEEAYDRAVRMFTDKRAKPETRKGEAEGEKRSSEARADNTDDLRKMLADVNAEITKQGRVVDDRLLSRKRELERLLKEPAEDDFTAAVNAAFDERFGGKATAETEPTKPKKISGRKDQQPREKKTLTEKAAARKERTSAAKAEKLAKFKDLLKQKKIIKAVYDPKAEAKVDAELLAATVELTAAAIDDGVSTFLEYVTWIADNIGESATRKIAPYLEAGWARLGTYERFRGKIDEAGKVADVLMEVSDVDTTRDDNPEAMGDEPTKPGRKPKKDRETGKAPGSDQPADTSGRGDDEGAGSGPTEDSGGNRDGISSPAGSLNNHQIAERPDWLEGGPVTKLNRNIDAITTMNRVEAEGRRATPGEQAIIAGYTGWGHLKQFFIRDSDLRAIKAIQGDKWNLNAFKTLDARVEEQIRDNGRRKGSTSEQIETKIQREKANNKHRIRLATSMTPAEYAQARKSTRYSHYTDPAIARAMWGFLRDAMPEAGKIRVLEPSEGSGMFWGTMPDSMFNRAEMHGIDMDPSSSRIAKHLYPSVRHLNVPFQQSPYPEGFFDLAITNVPFNKNPVQDPSAEFSDELSLHNYFFAKTASRLREGGVVAFITTHFTMDAANAKQRSVITNQGLKFLGAVRLNQDAFGNVANTKVTTDIIVMQKVAPGTLTTNNTFELAATTMAAPHGEEVAEITVHPYFQSKPGMVAGQITANGEMRGAAPELTVESDMTPEETAEFISRMLGKIEIDKQAFIEGQQQRNDMAEVPQGATTFVPEHLQGLDVGKMAVDGSNLVVRTSAETMLVVKTEFSPTLKARAEKWFAIRDALTNLQQLQTSPDNPEAAIEAARKELNRVYDDFVGEFNEKKNDYSGYKPLNTTYNRSMFAADYMSATVQALENTKLIPTGELDKNGKEKTRLRVEKASIFTERTEWPLELRPKPQTVKEALAHSMFTNGGVDIDWIATTLGKSKVEVAKQLEKYAFEVPNDGGWEINEVYLSGNIAKKLEVAEEAASKNPVFTRNVDALREVLPVPKTFEQLVVYPNSPFLPADLLREFVSDALGLGSFDLYRNDQELGGGWRANYDKSNEVNQTTQDLEQYAVRDGSKIRKRGFELFLDMIAGKPTIILDKDAHDRTFVHERLTNLAKSKRLDLSRAFDTFIRSAQERMDAVTNEFNRLLSGYVKPLIPEWVVSFDGMSSNWKDLIRPYQKEAAAKVAMGGNTLLAHRVGYGKTLSGVAGIMEQRRLGVARKPLVVVPNHLTGQWAKSFADFYPSAKVMAPTSKDFEKKNRQATMNRIMTGNWDAVIIPESSFKKLPMSSEYVEQFFQEQIAQSIDAAERARAEEGGDPRTIAELEDVTERLRNQLAKYLAEAQKDPGPFFDEMGIDSLTVDEAHHYKNLPFYTQNTRVAGINPTGSQQAFDMLMKTDFINALTGSRNVTFLTGTPIANSMTEAWVMMRYLMPEAMKEANVFAFDDWKNTFGEVVDRTRVNTIGTGFRTESRFQQFVNLDVLSKMFQQVADIQMINNDVQVPPVQGGKPRSIVVPASDAMKNFMLGLAARSANMPQDPSEDNMLNVMTVGAGAAIDFRLLDAAAMPSETSKITVAADEVARIFQETSPFKGTQIVWSDRGVPKAAKKLTSEMQQLGAWMLEEVQSRPLTMEDVKAKWKEMRPTKNSSAELQRFMAMTLQDMNYTTGTEDDEVSYKVDMKDEPTVWVNEITDVDPNITEQAAPPWNVYQQMKDDLVARGVPANQIVFIHDFKTAAQKVQLWEKMNNGDLRVLLGNTPRLGTGANIQQRLVAAHHLDAPWRPADVEQRDGRIIRSGNRVITIGDKIGYAEETGVDLDGVINNRYVTEGSIDARYWDTNEMKAQMLQDFWSGNPGVSIEELGATTLSMSDVKAAAVANPLLKRKIELEHEVNKLSEEYRGAVQSKTQSDSRLREAQQEVPEAKKKLEAAKKRVAWWEAGKAGLPEGENFGVEIDGEVLFRRDDIGEAIDRKLHEIGRNIPLADVTQLGSDWAKQSLSKSSDELELGKIFGKKITVSVEGGFRNPETGEVVGGNTWQEKQLAKQLKDGSWERSYSNALVRVAGVDGLARLGSNPQGFAARLRNFSDPGENWIEGHEKALASKEKALKELENLVKSIPEPDSSKLVAKQQELEEVANEIGDEDDDQITYWVATEELERTLGPDTLHEQLGRVDSVEVLLGYINHPKDGKLSVFNRAGDTRPPAHAMVWVEGENAIVGYVPRDDEGVMGLPILKPRKLIGVIQHPEHGELMVFDHKEGELTQQGKVWVEKEDGSQEFGYQDKALNVVMGVEILKTESFGGWPEDVKRHTEQSKKPRKPTGQSDASTSTNSASSDPQQPRLDAFTSPELQDRQSMGAARVRIASAADLVGDEELASGSEYASPDKEFERRWQSATKGIGKKSLATKLREFWEELVKSTVRGSLPELPRTQQFGEARSAMHAYQNAPVYAQIATADLLKKTSKPLSASDYDLFTRVVIMRDQVEAASKGERLSYGLTPEKAQAELARVEALAENNERVQASLEYRRQWTEAMVDDFLSAHEYLGLDMSDRFNRENYFRHQVLYYMEAEQQRLGKKKVELTPNRSWLKGRTSGEDLGEAFDINANYLQAEWEVSTQMIADTKRAQAIGRLKRHYDKMRQLKEKAKYNNYVAVVGGLENMQEIEELRGLMAELRESGSLDSGDRAQIKAWSERIWELDPTMPFRQRMAIARDQIERGAAGLGEDASDDFMRYVSSLAKRDDSPLQGPALSFLKALSDRKAFIKNALGDQYQTWEDVVPDDHEEVAIRPGRAMFQAYSVPEQVASELMADLSRTLGISAEDLRPLTALGSKYTPLVVPQEVAAQMAAIDNKMDFGWLDRAWTRPMNAWKRWVLMSPTRVFKYNLRNLSEVDKVMALNPAALKDIPQAIRDLWKLYSGADDIPATVRDWVERGGSGTLVRVNELGELNELKQFAKLIADKRSGVVGKVIKAPANAWKAYWSAAGISSDFRESILRYAAYLNYLKQLDAGKLTNYGGSVRAEVDGIKDNKDKAMRLSADLLGDYGDISLVGQFLRSRFAPFWSFQETNLRTYFRGLVNLASNEQSAIKAGMQIARSAGIGGLAKTPFLAYKLGRIAILFYGLKAMTTAFNQLLFGDDDDELSEEEKRKAHLTFGKNSKGEVQYFSRIGTAADVLDWVGLDSVDYDLRDVLDGRRTLKEVLNDMARSPVDKAYGMLSPFIKVPVELAVGQTAYPSVGKPRPIRDRGRYIAQNLGLQKEYDKLVGNPSTPYSVTDLFLYKVEPGTSDYYLTLDAKFRWLKTARNRGVGYSDSSRGNALRNYKMAVRLKDQTAVDKYLAEYEADEGTKEGLLDSLEWSHPAGGLSTIDAYLFYKSLAPVEQAEYRDAERFYYSELLTEEQAKTIRARRDKRLRDLAVGKNKDGSPKGKPVHQRGEAFTQYRERLSKWQDEREIAREALQEFK